MDMDSEEIYFAGLRLSGLKRGRLFPEAGVFKFVVTVNADFVVTAFLSPRFARTISSNIATIDGQVTLWLARLLGRPRGRHLEKISGSDFLPELLEYCARNNLPVFVLGGAPSVNRAFIECVRRSYGCDIEGWSPPNSPYPFPDFVTAEALDRIDRSKAKVLVVALGAPKQEYWIEDNKDALAKSGVIFALGCGGAVDFVAGRFPRAPLWMQRSGLEGVFRLFAEPRFMRVIRLLRSSLVLPIALAKFRRNPPVAR